MCLLCLSSKLSLRYSRSLSLAFADTNVSLLFLEPPVTEANLLQIKDAKENKPNNVHFHLNSGKTVSSLMLHAVLKQARY